MGQVSFGGPDASADPAALPPSGDAAVAAARATDPAKVHGYIGITGVGCPPASELGLG